MPSSRRKRSWWLLAHLGVQPRVVGQGVDARILQRGGQFLHALARLAIHHARLARVLALDKAQQLRGGVLLLDDGVADVGPVKAADEQAARLPGCRRSMMSCAREGIGRGRERNARHPRIALVQHASARGTRGGSRAPTGSRNALRRWQTATGGRCRTGCRSRPRKRGVVSRSGAAYSSVMAPVCRRQLHVLRLLPVERGVENGRIHPGLVQRAHLVVHQRDQRRDHDGHAPPLLLAHDGGHLVAQRFAPPVGMSTSASPPAITWSTMASCGPRNARVAKNAVENGKAQQTQWTLVLIAASAHRAGAGGRLDWYFDGSRHSAHRQGRGVLWTGLAGHSRRFATAPRAPKIPTRAPRPLIQPSLTSAMPIYEYACHDCGHAFEALVRSSTAARMPRLPLATPGKAALGVCHQQQRIGPVNTPATQQLRRLPQRQRAGRLRVWRTH